MARPHKVGLDYFPLDVDFFEDDKIQFVSARFEEKGELIAAKLLCKIYKNGYYIEWTEDHALLFAKAAGKNITNGLVIDVVKELLKREFFNETLYKRFGVLTSYGIQRRYKRICTDAKRKVEIDKKYDVSLLTPEYKEFTPVETLLTPVVSTQRKEKEIKEKSKSHSGASPPADLEKKSELFWEKLVDEWFEFYGRHFKTSTGEPAQPVFNVVCGAHLKKIISHLRQLAKQRNKEWTEMYAVNCLRGFLIAAYKHDDWIRKNFELGNLLAKFNSITNTTLLPENGNLKKPAGSLKITSHADYDGKI